MELKYVGGHTAVSVPLPNGGEVLVVKNGKGDFPTDVANGLLAQGKDHWVKWATDGRSAVAHKREEG